MYVLVIIILYFFYVIAAGFVSPTMLNQVVLPKNCDMSLYSRIALSAFAC